MGDHLVPLLKFRQLAGNLGCLLACKSIALILIFIFSKDFIDGISLCCLGRQRVQTRRLVGSVPDDHSPTV